MMATTLSQILLLVPAGLLILLTGFFVAAEFALVKVRATRIEELAAQNRFGARKTRDALRQINEYLSATQLGITIATLTLGSFGESVFEGLLEPVFHGVPKAFRHAIVQAVSLLLVVVLEVVIGEMAPKTIAIQRAERVALALIYPLDAFYRVFKPLIALMNFLAGGVLKPFGLRLSGGHEHSDTHSEAELRLILEASHAGGAIPESEWTLASRVFDFVHRQAKDVMVPRPDIVFLRADRPLAENRSVAESSGFTRFPLVEDGSADRIVGMVHIRDLFAGRPDDLRSVARSIPRVPETKRIDQMLRDLQRGRLHMAVVSDEYGGTAGIVTLEDIIEEIVGDIQDEYDPTAPEMEDADTGYLVDARITLDKLARDLEINPPDEEVDVDTVGGWIMTQCETPIRAGTQARYGRALFTVAETSGRRIRKVRVTVPEDLHKSSEADQ